MKLIASYRDFFSFLYANIITSFGEGNKGNKAYSPLFFCIVAFLQQSRNGLLNPRYNSGIKARACPLTPANPRAWPRTPAHIDMKKPDKGPGFFDLDLGAPLAFDLIEGLCEAAQR